LKIFGNLIRHKHSPKRHVTSERHGLKVVGSGQGAVILAIGGGKGGVGKSMVASNMALMLAERSYRTLLVDVDLGAANLHSFLGMEGSKLSLSSYLKGEIDDFDRLITPTAVEGLDIVTGAKDSLDVADMATENLLRLQKALNGKDYDYILLDLGPGTSANVLDILFFSDYIIIITTPDPTSVENTYRYLKALVLRRIKASITEGPLKSVLHNILKGAESGKIKTIAELITLLRRAEKTSGEFVGQLMGKTKLSLLMNQTRCDEDREAGMKIEALCCDNLGMSIRYLGDIPYDEAVVESIRKRKPLSLNFKGTEVCTALERLVGSIIDETMIKPEREAALPVNN